MARDGRSYAEKLLDPRWQQKRLGIFNRDSWTCKRCSSTDKTLHVHHIFYFKDTDPWDIEDGFLITLCEDCHKNHKESAVENLEILLKTLWRIGFNLDGLVSLAEWLHYFYKGIDCGDKTEEKSLVGYLPIIEGQ